ncbi:apoptosis-inducing factor 2 [Trematomus bernacchii]|uniref:apoptosis-inducing factor 2 n=1 Tax=Trematomus bernacchii TaxID=40690 RepID=UPI00146A3159|nr:apoptosis-inducing factor 2 [Trematomus bernacchii]
MGGWFSSSSPPPLDSSVHVVVVGGGFGGIAASRLLQDAGISFTLLDLRDSFHHNVGALRASVQPGFAERTFIPFSETFGESFVQGRVQRVNTETQTVVLEGGREFQYSHLIVCTGMIGAFPGRFVTEATLQSAVRAYGDLLEQVQAADSVLVVGGGSTGVEMAAEIKTQYPHKKVVLIHSRVHLADPGLLPSVREQSKEVLLEKGVELILGEKVSNLSELQLNVVSRNSEVKTDKGQTLTSDLIISCTGLKVNSDAYASSFSDSLVEGGALKVNPHLQVEGFSNVFAVGDCTDIKEPKTAYNAELHAHVAVSNIKNILSGKELTSYQTGSVTMLLAMGPDDGVGQFNGWQLPRFLVTLGKSRNLLVWKSWRDMKQSQH